MVIERALMVPVDVLAPTADAQTPVTRADDVALDPVANVVSGVVVTVTVVEPNAEVMTNDASETEVIVPRAAPNPPPPNPRPPKPPPKPRPPADPVGAGIGAPLLPPDGRPLGGVPLPPPKPPVRCAHGDVLVIDTVLAVMALRGVPLLLPRLLLAVATVTQSPFASDDNETAEIFENCVVVAHATVVVPLVDCTDAPAAEIDSTLPETAPKLAKLG
jgi:hypothetical protein